MLVADCSALNTRVFSFVFIRIKQQLYVVEFIQVSFACYKYRQLQLFSINFPVQSFNCERTSTVIPYFLKFYRNKHFEDYNNYENNFFLSLLLFSQFVANQHLDELKKVSM